MIDLQVPRETVRVLQILRSGVEQEPWPIEPAAEPEPLARAVERGIRGLRRSVRAFRGTG